MKSQRAALGSSSARAGGGNKTREQSSAPTQILADAATTTPTQATMFAPQHQLTPATDAPARAAGGKKRQRTLSSLVLAASPGAAEAGLRNFSLRVCNVVQTRKHTTYTDVADALVEDLVGRLRSPEQEKESLNIRR